MNLGTSLIIRGFGFEFDSLHANRFLCDDLLYLFYFFVSLLLSVVEVAFENVISLFVGEVESGWMDDAVGGLFLREDYLIGVEFWIFGPKCI